MKTKFFFFLTILPVISVFSSCDSNDEDDETTVADFDGNEYNVVEIGDDFWLVENLITTHYNNGDPIPLGLLNGTTGSYVNYDTPQDDAVYGLIYNWYAVNDSRGICPQGWHIPSRAEWELLAALLGGDNDAGAFLKDTLYWDSPNTGANNETGFTARPGAYGSIGQLAAFWSSTERDSDNAYYFKLYYNNTNAFIDYAEKGSGFNCRCIKD